MWKINNIIDLSIPLTEDTPVYPGDSLPQIIPASSLEKEGYNLHQLRITTHTGTHLDAPAHLLAGGLTLDRLDLSLFAAEGVVVPVPGKQPGEEITLNDLPGPDKLLSPGMAVLFHTGWSKKAGCKQYYRHPYLSEEACQYLLGQGIRTFGIDTISIDPPDSTDFPVHRLIAANEGVIIENLANLEKVTFPHPLILCLPLPLKSSDGSPVRAVALGISWSTP